MSDYKPDWDSIPAKLKYCYVENGEGGVFSVIYRCEKFPVAPPMTEYIRPPELVDGAWYAFTSDNGVKMIGRYVDKKMYATGGYHWPDQMTIHQRIPDSIWECEDEQ